MHPMMKDDNASKKEQGDVLEIQGEVVVGKRLGHTMGFPTANIKPFAGQTLPENGVYIGDMEIEGLPGIYRCVVNQGMQPTLPSGHRTIEAFILNFHRDIYGCRVALTYLHRLRSEHKFDNKQDLADQIRQDAACAENWQVEE